MSDPALLYHLDVRVVQRSVQLVAGRTGQEYNQRKNRYDKLRELVSVETYDQVKQYHKGWVEEYFGDGNNRRDEEWTKSIAVGSKAFVESVKTLLGAIARGRKVREAAAAYQLREPSALYGGHFEVKNDDIGVDNTYFWDIKPE